MEGSYRGRRDTYVRRSFTFYLYSILGVSPCSGVNIPSFGITIPNLFVFTVVAFLTLMLFEWNLHNACLKKSWATCVLDFVEAFPLIVILQLHMFHKINKKRSHFNFLLSVLPMSTTTKLEITSLVICTINNMGHQIVGSITMTGAMELSFFSLYLITAYLSFLHIIQFTAIVYDLNAQFELLISKTRRINSLLLSKVWTLFEAVHSINYIYGSSLLFFIVWLSGKLVSNLFKAVIIGAKQKDYFGSAFLCVSAAAKFSIIFTSLRACEQTKWLVDTFNNKLFKIMRENEHLTSYNKLYLYATMTNTINFTACGFFSLGYPLVTSIIAAATTYLVILVQLEMPSGN